MPPRKTTTEPTDARTPPPKTGPLTAATYSQAILSYTRQRGGPFPILDSLVESDRAPMRAWLGWWQHLGLRWRAQAMEAALMGRGGETRWTVAERWPSDVTGESQDDRHPPCISPRPDPTETGRLDKLPPAVRLAFEVERGRMSEEEARRRLEQAVESEEAA